MIIEFKPLNDANKYYSFNLKDRNSNKILQVYIAPVDNQVWISISESFNGFDYNDVTTEFPDLDLTSKMNLEEVCNYLKNYFAIKNYIILTF